MGYFNFLVGFAGDAEGRERSIFDDKLALLERGNLAFDFLEVATRHTEQVFDNTVGDALLLHNKRILGVGVEVEVLALELVHILRSENDG